MRLMYVTVHLDQLHSYGHDPQETAKRLKNMQQKGVKLNVHVKDPHTAEVFKYLSDDRSKKPSGKLLKLVRRVAFKRWRLRYLILLGIGSSGASIAYGFWLAW